jgi:hypothetical protein
MISRIEGMEMIRTYDSKVDMKVLIPSGKNRKFIKQ